MEQLNAYLTKVDGFNKKLQHLDSDKESGRYDQTPRALKNIQDVYKEIIRISQKFIDSNKNATNAIEIKKKAKQGIDEYRHFLSQEDGIGDVGLAIMDTLLSSSKGFKGDSHLLELQEKELQRKQGQRESVILEKNDIDAFLTKIGDSTIDTYVDNSKITNPIEQIREQLEIINAANEEIENIEKSRKKEENKEKEKAVQNDIINKAKNKIKVIAQGLSKSGVRGIESILDETGEFNQTAFENIENSAIYIEAKSKRDFAARSIAAKFGLASGLAGALVGEKGAVTQSEIAKYLPSLAGKGNIDNNLVIKNIQDVIADLVNLSKISTGKRNEIDVIDRQIVDLEDTIKMIKGRQQTATGEKGESRGFFRNKVKTKREYEESGQKIDETYNLGDRRQKLEDRIRFAETLYPKDMNVISKWIRSRFRAIFNSKEIAYALSAEKERREQEQATMASAFREALSAYNNDPTLTKDEAQVMGLRALKRKQLKRDGVDEDSLVP